MVEQRERYGRSELDQRTVKSEVQSSKVSQSETSSQQHGPHLLFQVVNHDKKPRVRATKNEPHMVFERIEPLKETKSAWQNPALWFDFEPNESESGQGDGPPEAAIGFGNDLDQENSAKEREGKQAEIVVPLMLEQGDAWSWPRTRLQMQQSVAKYRASAGKPGLREQCVANMEAAARDWCQNGQDLQIAAEDLLEILEAHKKDLTRGGGAFCTTQCVRDACRKANRKWAGVFLNKYQNYELGFGFYTVYQCPHKRKLKPKWFIDEKAQIHSSRTSHLVKLKPLDEKPEKREGKK